MSDPILHTPTDARKLELLMLAAVEGFELPRPVEEILALEDAGAIVNLRTGAVVSWDADSWLIVPTVVGEATAVVLAADEPHCPHCYGAQITTFLGSGHCHDCGHKWVYEVEP